MPTKSKRAVKRDLQTARVLKNLIEQLEYRERSADSQRTPGGVQPAGVYMNGFHVGMLVAIGLIKSELEKAGFQIIRVKEEE